MTPKIHTIVVAFAGAVAGLILAFSVLPAKSALPREDSPDVVSSSGRYRIVMREGIRADSWLLDTATGLTWREVSYVDIVGQPVIWKFQDRIDDNASLLRWSSQQKLLEKTKTGDTPAK